MFPGSNAPARRWPPDRFAAVARRLVEREVRIVVLGSAVEAKLTARVAAGTDGAIDAGGATDLPELAALLSLCDVLVTNDTGPMHLASAVGTPTVTLWGPSDPAEVCPTGPGHVGVSGPGLACRPCFKNECPRTGKGTLLSEAREECMHLITIEQVVAAAGLLLERDPA
jgi:ADP-heptose:LPS heptosyltransferase